MGLSMLTAQAVMQKCGYHEVHFVYRRLICDTLLTLFIFTAEHSATCKDTSMPMTVQDNRAASCLPMAVQVTVQLSIVAAGAYLCGVASLDR